MHNKEKDQKELDIDLLLRDVAAEENDALPLSDWKHQIFAKIESGQTDQGSGPVVDELAARRRKNLRRWTISFSTAAAALLIVLGTSQYWQQDGKAKAAPSEMQQDVRMAAEEAAPEAGTPEASLYAAEAPMAIEAPSEAPQAPSADVPAPAAPVEPAPSDSSTGNAASGAGQANMMTGPVALTQEQQHALDAVTALLTETRGNVDAAAASVALLENSTITIRPFSGGEAVEMTFPRVYQVVIDPNVEGAPSYAVDVNTYEVLGEIAEG